MNTIKIFCCFDVIRFKLNPHESLNRKQKQFSSLFFARRDMELFMLPIKSNKPLFDDVIQLNCTLGEDVNYPPPNQFVTERHHRLPLPATPYSSPSTKCILNCFPDTMPHPHAIRPDAVTMRETLSNEWPRAPERSEFQSAEERSSLIHINECLSRSR